MKKYLFLILTLLLFGFSTSANANFKPATLYLELPGFIVREAVYTKERADLLFSLGCKLEQSKMLGSTITTINSTDLIKDSRAVINTNFSNLNTDKLERSAFFGTTTLPQITTMSNLATVGTITSGTWNGTAITVAKGGTGSTTLLSNGVLYGSSTNAISAVPLGTNGQLLTLSGGIPVWATPSVDQATDYTWTGNQTLTGTTTLSGTTTASNLYISSSTVTQYPIASTSIATKGYVDYLSTGFAFGQAASTTPGLGTMLITHNLGAIPRLIKITSFSAGAGAYSVMQSVGMATSTGASQSCTVVYDNGSDSVVDKFLGYIIFIEGAGGANKSVYAAVSALTTTTFTLNFTTFGSSASVYYQWEAYK